MNDLYTSPGFSGRAKPELSDDQTIVELVIGELPAAGRYQWCTCGHSYTGLKENTKNWLRLNPGKFTEVDIIRWFVFCKKALNTSATPKFNSV